MYRKKLLILIIAGVFSISSFAQVIDPAAEADANSYKLYNEARWKDLLQYGKEKLAAGVDFPLLRMRTGYAAFMLGNYGQSLKQYKKVLDADPSNGVALYYVYLDNLYLNNVSSARYYARKLPEETKASEKIRALRLSAVEAEYSFKHPTEASRDNGHYARIGMNLQLGYRLEFQQSFAMFNQRVSEPALLGVVNNRNINVKQKEYYGKLTFAASGSLALIGAAHYFYTPYNNFTYHNFIASAGIRYSSPFVHVKAMANFGNITDSAYNQYDLTLSLYPLGNTKLYTVTRAAYGDRFTLSQVLGYRVAKKVWLEGNVTIGKFNNLLENDGLYVYNDIDQKQVKAGGSIYAFVSKKVMLSANYTFEQKLKYRTLNNYFYQHSINGGITWNF